MVPQCSSPSMLSSVCFLACTTHYECPCPSLPSPCPSILPLALLLLWVRLTQRVSAGGSPLPAGTETSAAASSLGSTNPSTKPCMTDPPSRHSGSRHPGGWHSHLPALSWGIPRSTPSLAPAPPRNSLPAPQGCGSGISHPMLCSSRHPRPAAGSGTTRAGAVRWHPYWTEPCQCWRGPSAF